MRIISSGLIQPAALISPVARRHCVRRPEGIGIFEYAGRITVTFRYDTATIAAAEAERMLARYIECWQEWLVVTADRADTVVPLPV